MTSETHGRASMWALYHKLREHSLTGRVLLIPVFVAGCYLYDWLWLRALTTVTLVWMSAVLGIPMHRIGADVVLVAGVYAQFVVACTMIDAFCGAIPLLWRTTVTWSRNLMRLGGVLGALFVLNIVRLEVGFIAMSMGAPWWLAHECVAGVAYFCLYLFVLRERAWERPQPTGPSATGSIHSPRVGVVSQLSSR